MTLQLEHRMFYSVTLLEQQCGGWVRGKSVIKEKKKYFINKNNVRNEVFETWKKSAPDTP